MAAKPMIEAVGLEKSYGSVRVLAGVDLEVAQGSVLALLGPNGAGKTTAVRILATLGRPDAGQARVAGFDVVTERRQVRRRISLTGQFAALDELQTGQENLHMMGRLSGLSGAQARRRAGELLEQFDLAEAGRRTVATWSGGMRRRLDLAAALVFRPPVLFLDEPTTGLDPRSRLGLWETIEARVAAGTTVLLTTQYLDEADRLADRCRDRPRHRDRRGHVRRAQGPRRRRASRGHAGGPDAGGHCHRGTGTDRGRRSAGLPGERAQHADESRTGRHRRSGSAAR
jgi:ABC-2 type transport system ATP-binding protein